MDGVRAFNLPVDNMARASRFYRETFGWDIRRIPGSGGDYHFAVTTPADEEGKPKRIGAINGGLFERGTHGIRETFLEIMVESIDECVLKVVAAAGREIRAKKPIAGTSFFAIVQDSEGNYLGLWEEHDE
ncbi:MAG: VOC family protein [Deltaproteobacteria bacterium]|nr:VOC family protein [Deltaproteobacteria bacterium]